jgi:hypothetical protein
LDRNQGIIGLEEGRSSYLHISLIVLKCVLKSFQGSTLVSLAVLIYGDISVDNAENGGDDGCNKDGDKSRRVHGRVLRLEEERTNDIACRALLLAHCRSRKGAELTYPDNNR